MENRSMERGSRCRRAPAHLLRWRLSRTEWESRSCPAVWRMSIRKSNECGPMNGRRCGRCGKGLEVSYWKDSHDQLKAELDHMTEANRLLQAENDQLKTMHGLPNCYLENRWSNCAVRMRKQRELDNNGNHVNGNNRGLRSLAS